MSSQQEGDDLRLNTLQQQIQDWYRKKSASGAEDKVSRVPLRTTGRTDEAWSLTGEVRLYDWQRDCLERWFANHGRGTVKVVTGAGKTMLALAITQRLQNSSEPGLRVAIIVPTIVLMEQWYRQLQENGNLPTAALGRLGGGYRDDFGSGCRILITVLASASEQLAGLVDDAGVGDRLLLIADESHRLGAAKRQAVLQTRRRYSLGLSATPERSDDEWGAYDKSPLAAALGRIIYTLNYKEAREQGVIPSFVIRHFGLPLNEEDDAEYRKLTRTIKTTRSTLKGAAPGHARSEAKFWEWLRGTAIKDPQFKESAARLEWATATRKQLLYAAPARLAAVHCLIKQEVMRNPRARIILFHETIEEAMQLYLTLHPTYPTVVEHSQLPRRCREEGIALFRSGEAQVLVSVKSLIEGFDVPAADVGIIVASSSSVRQRIQSMGRVMRRSNAKTGAADDESSINVLYMRGTTDESIYGKLDWEEVVGAGVNQYYLWDPPDAITVQSGPPDRPPPKDHQVDVSQMQPGDVYPGAYEGQELTCDTGLNVQTLDRRDVDFPQPLARRILELKGGGRFKVSPTRGHVLVRLPQGDDWQTRFVGNLEEQEEAGDSPAPPHKKRHAVPPRQKMPGKRVVPRAVPRADHSEPSAVQPPKPSPVVHRTPVRRGTGHLPGSSYPMTGVTVTETLRYRLKRGGIIGRKVPYGELFARDSSCANDPAKGADADDLLAAIRARDAAGDRVTKIMVTGTGDVVYRAGSEYRFLATLHAGLEFPDP